MSPTSAFVPVLGRPSCGKSTFINAACGHKVSIVSPVPQTTRNRIRGIVNRSAGQIVFVDTPGLHLSGRKMNRRMRDVALSSLQDADVLLYLVDATRAPGEEERSVAEAVRDSGIATVAAISKVDLLGSGDRGLDSARQFLRGVLPAVPVHPLSAVTGEGVEPVLEAILSRSPEGHAFYPPEYATDQTPEFRVAELVRESAIHASHGELPHCLYVEVADAEMHQEPEEHLWVRAFIVVEREGQKGILVGRGGERIRSIVREAEGACEAIFPYPVRLDVRVKVRPGWRANEALLRKLVY